MVSRDVYRYFVLKIDHLIDSLREHEIPQFMDFLDFYNEYRKSINKNESKYWVVNREDVPHIKTIDEFLETVGYLQLQYGDIIVIDNKYLCDFKKYGNESIEVNYMWNGSFISDVVDEFNLKIHNIRRANIDETHNFKTELTKYFRK